MSRRRIHVWQFERKPVRWSAHVMALVFVLILLYVWVV
jgi:predicted nucleic acid-binding Zn ribbon protein